jgi:uncharacterized coiled-coil protein SlyX
MEEEKETRKPIGREVVIGLSIAVIAGILVSFFGVIVNEHGKSMSKLEAQVEILGPRIDTLQSTNEEHRSKLEAKVEELQKTNEERMSELEGRVSLLESEMPGLRRTVSALGVLEVIIVEPKNDAVVECEEITEDNQCAITVDIEIVGILSELARVRMLVRVEGGQEWWVGGGEGLPGPDNKCSIGFVTLGSADGPSQRHELMAIVTEQALEPGSRHTVIPDHVARSSSVVVLVRKGNE